MTKSRISYVIVAVGIALAGLLGVQFYWAHHTYELMGKEFSSDVKLALRNSVEEINKELFCYETFSKVHLNPNEGFYILKHKWMNDRFLDPSHHPPDTIPSCYYDPALDEPFRWNDIKFTRPVNISFVLQYEYTSREKNDSLYPSGNPFDKATKEDYKDAFSERKPIERRYDPFLFDSILRKNLHALSIHSPYYFGFINNERNSVAFAYPGHAPPLLNSSFRQLLTPSEYFSRPYDVAVGFENYSAIIFNRMAGLLALSLLIALILLVSFYLFVRIILRQRRLSELKNDFINNMTHEFKTPLTNISLALENIEDNGFSTAQKDERIIRIIGQETERLKENIDRILQIARFEKEKLQLSGETIDLDQLIKKVILSFDTLYNDGGVSFNYTSSPREFMVHLDEVHFFNAIYNIIDNGIKYNLNKPEVEIRVTEQRRGVTISIKDNGIGISAMDQKKVFEKFHRVPSGNLHNVKGYGLGLSYVKLVVEAHHGFIQLLSKPGSGSEFKLFIPYNYEGE